MNKNYDEEYLLKSKRKVFAAARKYGLEPDDVYQDYCLQILEGKSKSQTLKQFCIDYIRYTYGDNRTDYMSGNNYKIPCEEIKPLVQFSIDNHIYIKEMLIGLTSLQRKNVIDYYLIGKSLLEIAKKRGVSESAVSCCLRRAIEKMKESET